MKIRNAWNRDYLFFVGMREPLCGSGSGTIVHSHVERAVVAETEASRRVIELW